MDTIPAILESKIKCIVSLYLLKFLSDDFLRVYLTIKLGLYFLRPLADADVHAERRCCTAAASVFQRKLRRT